MRGIKILTSREQILQAIEILAQKLGRAPTTQELRQAGISPSVVRRVFLNHTSAVRALGLEPAPSGPGQKVSNQELLEDWATLARTLGKVPTQRDYRLDGRYSDKLLVDRFRRWSAIAGVFKQAEANGELSGEWKDVVELAGKIPVRGEARSRVFVRKIVAARRREERVMRAAGEPFMPELPRPIREMRCVTAAMLPVLLASILLGGGFLRQVLPDRPVLGAPLQMAGLTHEPVNEMGVSMLFAIVSRDLGFMIEAVQAAFPDCKAKMEVTPGRWQDVRIEFEYESRSFADHGHDPKRCDMIVCWRHNWKGCPEGMMVLELRRVIGRSQVIGQKLTADLPG